MASSNLQPGGALNHHAPRMLIIDDNDTGRYAVARTLMRAGWTVFEATSGAEGIRLAREQRPDVIVLDVNLPDQSGLEVCRLLKSDALTRRIPIIQVSAEFTSGEDRAKGLEGGADAYLIQPFETRELLAQTEALFRIRRIEEALYASEARFRALADNMTQLAWIANSEGEIHWYNRRWYEYTGLSEQEAAGLGWQRAHHPDHLDRVTRSLLQSFKAGVAWEETFPLRRTDGQYRWFLSRATPLRTDTVPQTQWFGTNTDITEHMESEKRLRDAEAETQKRSGQLELAMKEREQAFAFLDSLLANAPIGFAFFDRARRYVRINDFLAQKINGVPVAQHLNRTVDDVLPHNAGAVNPLIDRVFNSGESVENLEVEGETPAAPGQRRHWLAGFWPVRTPGGNTPWVGAVVLEITRQKRTEQALRVSEARFRTLFESELIGIAFPDQTGRYCRDANDHFLRMIGYSRDELIAGLIAWDHITPPEWRDADRRGIETLNRSGSCEPYEKEYIRKDGTRVPVLIGYATLESPEGTSIALIQDLSKQKAAEAAFRDAAEQRRLALEAGRLGTYDYNVLTGEVFWDRRFAEIFGLEGDKLSYEQILGHMHEEDRHRVNEEVRRLLSPSSSGSCELEYRVVWRDGTVHWVAVNGQVIFANEAGQRKAVRFLGTVRDITARKEAAEALARSHEQLENLVRRRTVRLQQAVAELEHFSYALVHDMRAPLRAMQGFAKLLEEESGHRLDKPALEHLRRILTSAHRLDVLITDSLNYSKVLSEHMKLEPVDLSLLLGGILESYPNLQPPKAEVELIQPLPTVLGNQAALTQCFSNLLGNAVKFVPPGRKAHARVLAEPNGNTETERVRIWVEDNGIGIAPEHHDRIFGMFQRLHNQREYEGTGIGLAIVRKVVEKMGGSVGVESAAGQGSRFWIELRRA